ncbi:MAG: glycosyltransferase family 39 protein [Chloroflexi bacterium]|nr:glycosyltransferase family 39 protein [Chloroflexota bacterium]
MFRFLVLVIAGTAAIYAFLWFAAITSPDLSWDGNAYHIPPISMWAAHGHVYWIETPYLEAIINGYPKGAEVVAYAMTMAFGNSVVNAVNLVFLPLGVLGIASLACSLKVHPVLALSAGALYLLTPVNINQSITTYVDSAFASSIIALTAIWFDAVQAGRIRKWYGALILGLSIGLALSLKSSGGAVCGIALIILFAVWGKDLIQKKPVPQSAENKPENTNGWRRLVLSFLLAGVAAAIGGGYWYIRNYLIAGSPLYPVGVSILGRTIFPGASVAEAISQASNTPAEIASLPAVGRVLYTWLQGLGKWPLSIKGYDTRTAGLGFLWIAGCVPSTLIFLISHLRKRMLASTSYLALFCLILPAFLLTPMDWWARYTLWIYALGLPAFAWAVQEFMVNRANRQPGTLLTRFWLATCILLAGFEGLYCAMDVFALATPGSVSSSPQAILSPETWTWPTFYLFPDMNGTALEDVLTPGQVIAIGPHGDSYFWRYAGLIGQRSQAVGKRELVFIKENERLEAIHSRHVEYIVWDASIPLPQSLAALPQEEAAGFIVLKFP